MADKRHALISLSSKASQYVMGMIATRFFGFLILPFVTRLINPEEYGLYSLCLTMMSIVGPTLLLGQHTSISVYFYEYKEEERKKFFGNAIFLSALFGSLFIALLAWRGKLIFSWIFPTIPFYPFILLTLLASFFSMFFEFPLSIYQISEQSKRYVKLTLIKSFLTFFLLLVFLKWVSNNALGAIQSTFVSSLALFLLVPFLLKGNFKLSLNLKMIGESFRFGFPLTAYIFFGVLISQMDKAFLGHYRTLSEVGSYSIASQFCMILLVLSNGINFAWSPFFLRTAKEKGISAAKLLGETSTYFLTMVWYLGLLLIFYSETIIAILAPSQYHAANHVVVPLVLVVCINTVYYCLVSPLFLRKRSLVLTIAQILGATLSFALSLYLVPRHGMSGAAWSNVAANLLVCLFIYLPSRNAYPIQLEWKRLGKVILILAIGFVLYRFGSQSLHSFSFELIKISILLLLPLILYQIGFFQREEISLFKKILRRQST